MTPAASKQGPLVSVLTPAFNAAATIVETLASARSQTYGRLEIIVVDDGSTDRTAELVRRVAAEDPRVRLLSQSNAGVAAARNAALAEAAGEYIAPLDADDLWRRSKTERQLERLCGQPDAGMVYCWSLDIDEQARVIERRLDLDLFEGDVYAPLVLTNFVGNASAPLLRRDVVEKAGGWDASLRRLGAQGCEDWKLYLQVAERSQVLLEPAFLVGYRQSPTAMSRRVDQMIRSYDQVIGDARRSHPELPSRLFRWSRAEFLQYAASLSLSQGRWLTGLARLGHAAALDPALLGRRSLRRKFRLWLNTRLGRLAPNETPYPIGTDFAEITEEVSFSLSDGRRQSLRRAEVSRICANRRNT